MKLSRRNFVRAVGLGAAWAGWTGWTGWCWPAAADQMTSMRLSLPHGTIPLSHPITLRSTECAST